MGCSLGAATHDAEDVFPGFLPKISPPHAVGGTWHLRSEAVPPGWSLAERVALMGTTTPVSVRQSCKPQIRKLLCHPDFRGVFFAGTPWDEPFTDRADRDLAKRAYHAILMF